MDSRFSQKHAEKFHPLLGFLARIPPVETNETPWAGFSTGENVDGTWWVEFSLDIDDEHAWHAVQELGHVLNLLSVDERLPTVFKPVSPPPYLNGGPDEFLSWMIECADPEMSPEKVMQWLEGRLPQPVEDRAKWSSPEDDDDAEDGE